MDPDRALSQRGRFARPTLERIRRDRDRASPRLAPVFEYLETHLFDVDLDVTRLKRACGLHRTAVARELKAATGRTLQDYLTRRRVEVAARLLRATPIPVWQVAQLVGYGNPKALTRAFKKVLDVTPQAYRKRHRAGAPAPAGVDEPDELEAASLERALHGLEDPATVRRLRDRLDDLLSQGRRDTERAAEAEADGLERKVAEAAWEPFAAASPALQRELVRRGAVSSRASFHLFLRRSREEGRKDRRTGVRLAELAVESLDALEGRLPPAELANLRALGWAWMGNARALSLDLEGAQEALDTAEMMLPEPEERDRRVVAEILHLKAGLRWYQHEFEEALELSDRAVKLFETAEPSPRLAEALLRRASIARQRHAYQAAAADVDRAEALLDSEQQSFLSLRSKFTRVMVLLELGDADRATTALREARKLAEEVGEASEVARSLWIEARIMHEGGELARASRRYISARTRFLEGEHLEDAAGVSMDLAICFAEQGIEGEVLTLVGDTIPLFAALSIHPPVLTALQLLRDMLERRRAPLDTLRQVRRLLEKVSHGRGP